MDWIAVGTRIRRQREYLGYTREKLAEKIEVTPKFCSDIELGLKGMSVPTLCKIASVLNLSTDYILFGSTNDASPSPTAEMLKTCPPNKRPYLDEIIKNYLISVNNI